MNLETYLPNKPITGGLTYFNDLNLTCSSCGNSYERLEAYAIPLPPEANHPDRRVFAIKLQSSSRVCACLAESLERNPLVALYVDSSLTN